MKVLIDTCLTKRNTIGASSTGKSESHSVASTLCDPMVHAAHGILQASTLGWAAFPFSRGSSRPGIELESPALQADSFPAELPGKLQFELVV